MALAGCGGGGASAPRSELNVVVPDGVLRKLGEPCAGGEPFLYVHATAAYRVVDAAGKTLASGQLPEGKAIAAFNNDPGVPRVPTFCQVSLKLGVPVRAGARLVLEQGGPQALKVRGNVARVILG